MSLVRSILQWVKQDRTSVMTVRAVLTAGVFSGALAFILSHLEAKDHPGTYAQGLAVALALYWPAATRMAYVPPVRRGPRVNDVLANMIVSFPAVPAAAFLWGEPDILPLCALGQAFVLASYALQRLQFSWGVAMPSLRPATAGKPERLLPATGANLAKVVISSLLSPVDNAYLLLVILLGSNRYTHIPTAQQGLYPGPAVKAFWALWLLIGVARLWGYLKDSLRIERELTVSLVYGLATAACAWPLLPLLDYKEPWHPLVVGGFCAVGLWLSLGRSASDPEPEEKT